MYVITYSRVINDSQDNDLQTIELKRIAEGKGWYIKKTFQEIIDETSNTVSRIEFKSLLAYTEKTRVDAVVVSEISAIGNRVGDIINCIELLHEKGIGLYINQFNLLTFENGKENPIAKTMLQALSIGAQIEKSQRLIRQQEGIKLARTRGVYSGRRQGANTSSDKLLKKYKDVAGLIDSGELSIRAIAKITNRSINTVRKVKELRAIARQAE